MKKQLQMGLISTLVLVSFSSAADVVRESTCARQPQNAPVLHNEDFGWGQNLQEIKEREQKLYVADKRLKNRAYVNEDGDIVLPHETLRQGKREIRLKKRFIQSIRAHIEAALKRNYVDAIIFSDMGHSHYFVPQDFYDNVLKPIPSDRQYLVYQKMLAHKDLKILYHTAEQLEMKNEDGELVNDRHIQWRFFTRNLVGDNKAQGHLELIHNEEHDYNTARTYEPGYRYWGAGFYLSANINGCFPFKHKGKTYYFDINLEGFRPASGGGFGT